MLNLDTYFTHGMFLVCNKLEYIKTPVGLQTHVSRANNDFKIVRLKIRSFANVEKENWNLNTEYTINSSGDKDAMYHIYCKDKYAGVTLDKNDGDSEALINHDIVEKGKTFSAGGGKLPDKNLIRLGYSFLGWDKNLHATTPDFNINTTVSRNIKVYAVWKKKSPFEVYIKFDKNGG